MKIDIDLGSTSWVFNRNHQLRLAISSSNSPRFEPNPNTGSDDWRSLLTIKANQKVFVGGDYPSRIILPIVEEGSSVNEWKVLD